MGIMDLFKNMLSQKDDSPNLISIYNHSSNQDLTNEEIELLHKKRLSAININNLTLKKPDKEVSLLPQEILFLIYIDKKDSSLNNLPKYWSFDYNLDFQLTLEKLFSYGYLKFSDSMYKLNNCTLKDLKEICKSKNLKSTGKKQELIDLISHSLKDEDIDILYPNKYFQITDKGQAVVAKNPHVYFFHSTKYLDIGLLEADNYLKENPNSDMFEAALKINYQRRDMHVREKDWGLYRNTFLSSSIVYKKSQKYDCEMRDLFIICILDLAGMGNNNTMMEKEYRELAPSILDFINLCQKNLNCKDEELYIYYENAFNELELFHKKIKKDNFFKQIIKEKNMK